MTRAAMRVYHPRVGAVIDRILDGLCDRFTRGELLVGILAAVAVVWFLFAGASYLVLR